MIFGTTTLPFVWYWGAVVRYLQGVNVRSTTRIDEGSGSAWGSWRPYQHRDLCPFGPLKCRREASSTLSRDNKWPIVRDWVHVVCVCMCVCVCLGWWWDWRVEGNPDEQTVTGCHVVGGGEHNGHLKEKVNNINPCLYLLLQPACSSDPSPTTWSRVPTGAFCSPTTIHRFRTTFV